MQTLHQLVRYGLVGLVSNALLYAAYLLLSDAGLGHKLAMSLVYCVGVIITFALNRSWTFRHDAAAVATFWRYVLTYAAGYIFNLVALWLLVDLGRLPHQWAMAALIAVTAVLIFSAQKFWVFAARRPALLPPS
ncbi:GtrA family protein [Peristeroidobacter agariperforans]|uniref:GtrA family protein n=1 Tax=Peristeroidobacter agariperforans TaxID=268404 RepID=UPI00101D667B|nr:GtrA family protein [Peristeroidobacter agariperforans]